MLFEISILLSQSRHSGEFPFHRKLDSRHERTPMPSVSARLVVLSIEMVSKSGSLAVVNRIIYGIELLV